jgi:hypothetical protein
MVVADARMPADRVAVVMPRIPGPDDPDFGRGARFHVLNMRLGEKGEVRAYGFLDFALARIRGGVCIGPGIPYEPEAERASDCNAAANGMGC